MASLLERLKERKLVQWAIGYLAGAALEATRFVADRFHWREVLVGVIALTVVSPLVAQDRAAVIDSVLSRFHETRRFNGVALVAERGKVAYKQAFGYANMEWEVPNAPNTKFRIASVNKQFTAVLILQLVEEGKLALDGTIRDYLPEYPAQHGGRVTIHHLLNHSSGIRGLPGIMEKEASDPYDPDSLVAIAAGRELRFEPGSDSEYSNSGYLILGAIIERVTDERYEVVLRERLLDPLSLRDTGYDHGWEVRPRQASGYRRTPSGYEAASDVNPSVYFAAATMYSTAEDLFHWDRALAARDPRILRASASWDAMFTPGLGDYGYGWIITERPIGENGPTVKMIQHGGGIAGFRTMFRRFPEQQRTVIVMDNTEGRAGEVASAITRILFGQPIELPKASIAEQMLLVIDSAGADAGIRLYHDLKRGSQDEYNFSSSELNTLGYHLLRRSETHSAIRIFRLRVEEYPDAWHAYHSLGEALLTAGDTVGAIDSYLASVRINRTNLDGAEVLAELGVEFNAALLEGIEVAPEILERYVGRYEIEPGIQIVIRREGGRLFAKMADEDEVELFATTERWFFARGAPFQFEFNYDGTGRIESVTVHPGADQQKRARRIEAREEVADRESAAFYPH